jgi:hypothetical protein
MFYLILSCFIVIQYYILIRNAGLYKKSSLCDGPITSPEQSYRVWRVLIVIEEPNRGDLWPPELSSHDNKNQTGNFPDMQTHNVLGAGFATSFRWNEEGGERMIWAHYKELLSLNQCRRTKYTNVVNHNWIILSISDMFQLNCHCHKDLYEITMEGARNLHVYTGWFSRKGYYLGRW